jgi:hypothetical protein
MGNTQWGEIGDGVAKLSSHMGDTPSRRARRCCLALEGTVRIRDMGNTQWGEIGGPGIVIVFMLSKLELMT